MFDPARDKYIVIMYHYIFDERPDRRGMHPRAVADFERELDFLASRYKIADIPEVLEAVRRGGPPACALTFDDATRDQYENAAPRLAARGLRGTFFVISEVLEGRLPFTHKLHLLLSCFEGRELVGRYHDFLDRGASAGEVRRIPLDRHLNPLRRHDDVAVANFKELFPGAPLSVREGFLSDLFRELDWDERALADDLFMQKSEIKDLAEQGHVIGTHGRTHRPFDTLTLPEIEDELCQSTTALAACLGQAPTIFSYPYGRLPEPVAPVSALVEKAGISYAVIMGYRSVSADDRPLLIPRWNTNHLRDYLVGKHE